MTHDESEQPKASAGARPAAAVHRPGTGLRIVQWLVAAGACVAVLSIVAVHLPARIKLIGLFAVVFGGLAGWVVGELAKLNRIHQPVLLLPLSMALIVAGQVGMAWEAHRLRADEVRAKATADPAGAMLSQFLHQQPETEAERNAYEILRKEFQAAQDQRRQQLAHSTSFASYLAQRTAALKFKTPWPQVFWCVEVLLGGLAGVWAVRRITSVKFCETCQSWYERQRMRNVEAHRRSAIVCLIDGEVNDNDQLTIVEFRCRCPGGAADIVCLLERPNGSKQRIELPSPDNDGTTNAPWSSLLDGDDLLG